MAKLFTLGEAQTMLPVLGALLRQAQTLSTRAGELEGEMNQLAQQIFLNGGTWVDIPAAARRRAEREVALSKVRETIEEIEEIGAEVHNLEAGLLDLPSIIDGEPVMLCWQAGESSISHWHETLAEGESAERQPLDLHDGRGGRGRPN